MNGYQDNNNEDQNKKKTKKNAKQITNPNNNKHNLITITSNWIDFMRNQKLCV